MVPSLITRITREGYSRSRTLMGTSRSPFNILVSFLLLLSRRHHDIPERESLTADDTKFISHTLNGSQPSRKNTISTTTLTNTYIHRRFLTCSLCYTGAIFVFFSLPLQLSSHSTYTFYLQSVLSHLGLF